MSSTMDHSKNFTSFEEACAAFEMTDPIVLVNHDLKNEKEAELAKKIAEELRANGINAISLLEFQKNELLPGQNWEARMEKKADNCTHMINIPSNRQGKHIALEGIVDNKSTKRRNILFQIESPEDWESEKAKIRLISAMISFSRLETQEEAEEAVRENGIDWSKEEFAHLLGFGVTVQELSDVAPGLIKGKRFAKVIIVNMGKATYHEVPKFSDAINIQDSETHDQEEVESPIRCCCRCGTERPSFIVDKSADGTHGVIIVPNDPCESCGIASSINPVPGFTLENSLNQIFAQ